MLMLFSAMLTACLSLTRTGREKKNKKMLRPCLTYPFSFSFD